MLPAIVENVTPTDVAGAAVVGVGILGFANVVPASDALSTWVMTIGIAAIFGPRMYRRVLSAWATRG